ncbi:hypothetical protein [Nocardioides ochotonae]|uniref:hypothetical protein n=1 Tax=Nocardioides ochotonae TaxID=2685869 RepID=UPI00140775F9|nr:hypothetical protein [Nocardioides ochotonae]
MVFRLQLTPLVLGMVLVAVSSILLVPTLIEAVGASAWAAFAVGQAVGGFCAVLILYGWGVEGPALVARASVGDRRRLVLSSLRLRWSISAPVLITGGLLLLALTDSHRVLAVAGMLTNGLAGLGMTWFFLGVKDGWSVFITDSMPRSLGNVLGILLLQEDSETAFASGMAVLVLAPLFGCLHGWLRATNSVGCALRQAFAHSPDDSIGALLGRGKHSVSTSFTGSIYTLSPVIIIAGSGAPSAPLFVLVDKAQKQLLSAFAPVANVLQAWVPRAREKELLKRVFVAALAAALFASGSLMCSALFGVPALEWLSAGTVSVSSSVAAWAGLYLGLALAEVILGRSCLVAIGAVSRLSFWSFVGAAIGLALLLPAGMAWGAAGALGAVSLGQGVRVCGYLFVIWSWKRRG